MSSATNDKISKEEKNGIANGHAYSLLRAYIEKDKDGNSIKLLKVRNPWGSGLEWKMERQLER